ncbi:hypothetical protein Q5H80_05930 [Vibrio sp. SNU_ST1]|uniref:hypothetical protein n=1 Tax=Vibrio sp. SNU_ST1 TaxID=3064001 RepID=UPI0027295559|nr:hypothetical protein [Vibrio sp. SNU_ST1]WKY59167.1 hypothetical protein Q5H80_05930 [Vibrio sp. SNU_ST1]
MNIESNQPRKSFLLEEEQFKFWKADLKNTAMGVVVRGGKVLAKNALGMAFEFPRGSVYPGESGCNIS